MKNSLQILIFQELIKTNTIEQKQLYPNSTTSHLSLKSFVNTISLTHTTTKKQFYDIAFKMVLENHCLQKHGGIFVNNHNFSKMVLVKPSSKHLFKNGFCQNHP